MLTTKRAAIGTVGAVLLGGLILAWFPRPDPIDPTEEAAATPVVPPPARRAVSQPPDELPEAVALDKAMRRIAEEAEHLLVSCRVGSGVQNERPFLMQHGWVQDGWFYLFPRTAEGSYELKHGGPEDDDGYRIDISWEAEPGAKTASCEVHPPRMRSKVTLDLRDNQGNPVSFQAYGCDGYGGLDEEGALHVWSQTESCAITVKPAAPYPRSEIPFEAIEPGAHIHVARIAALPEAPSLEEAIRQQQDEVIQWEERAARPPRADIIYDIYQLNRAVEKVAEASDPELATPLRFLLQASRIERNSREMNEERESLAVVKANEALETLEQLEALATGEDQDR